MNDLTVARRYARALYEEAEEAGAVRETDADIDLIRAGLKGSRDLVRVFESPIIAREKKTAILNRLFGERVQPLVLRFLLLLVEKSREDIFPAVVQAYGELRDAQQGIIEAFARSAFELSPDERQAITRALEQRTGKRIRLSVERDPDLIGGLVIRVGDRVYDGSVRNQLADLREQLEHAALRAGAAP